jgi:hypothetical protein
VDDDDDNDDANNNLKVLFSANRLFSVNHFTSRKFTFVSSPKAQKIVRTTNSPMSDTLKDNLIRAE